MQLSIISMICHSVPEIQCTSGLQSAILNSGCRPTSDKVGGITVDSGMVENVGLAVGISMICHSVPEIQCTSGLLSAILNLASRLTTGNVGRHQAMMAVNVSRRNLLAFVRTLTLHDRTWRFL